MDNEGTVYWITGLSGAGKTTIGNKLYGYLKTKKENVVILDGDQLREVYNNKDYTKEGRERIAYQNSRLCRMLAKQNIDVICCVIAMYEGCRRWNRENISNYKETYLRVTIEELIERDQKGLYKKALNKEISNVMGMDIPFEEPEAPDLIIHNNGERTPDEILEEIKLKFNI